MKTRLLILCVSVMIVFAYGQTSVTPLGDGSEGNPYQISSLENLYWVSQNPDSWGATNYFIQTQDINASETELWEDGKGWAPLGVLKLVSDTSSSDTSDQDPSGAPPMPKYLAGDQDSTTVDTTVYSEAAPPFRATYDGGDYAIDSLYIDRDTNLVAFIGQFEDGTVKNLGITNANITSTTGSNVAAIVGAGTGFTMHNCYCSGIVTAGGDKVGGAIGSIPNGSGSGKIYESTSSVDVTGDTYVGGFIGMNRDTIYNCYADGDVAATNGAGYAGGFAGYNWSGGYIYYVYSRGSVSASGVAGGLIGSQAAGDMDEGGSCFVSVWDTETSGTLYSAAGTGKTTTQMNTQSTFTDLSWDFANIWTMDSEHNNIYPYLPDTRGEIPMPIELGNFEVVFNQGVVEITWETASETNNAHFLIYRNDEVIASIPGAGTTSEPQAYSYCDREVIPRNTYVYMLADVSYANELVIHEDNAITITIDENDISESFVLKANYPNPFNPMTAIPFVLSTTDHIKLAIYDINGKLVRTLIDNEYSPGVKEVIWDGLNNQGVQARSGMYVARLTTGNTSEFIKMLLIK